MKEDTMRADQLTKTLESKYYSVREVSVEDLLKLQRKWAPLFKAARHPFPMCGQKYI